MSDLNTAIKLAGGQSALARKITEWHAEQGTELAVRQQYIWKWLRSELPVPPAEHCRAIEAITNGEVTRYDLRPDVFGPSANAEHIQIEEAA